MPAGTYLLKSLDAIYVGSSANLVTRKRDHLWRLRIGKHPVKKIQKAFNESGAVTFTPVQFLQRGDREDDKTFRDRLRAAEQGLFYEHAQNPGISNTSPFMAFPDHIAGISRNLWKDPEWRAAAIERMRKQASNPTPETREKMAAAKRGARNAKSRAVIVTSPDGTETRYESASEASKFFCVTQQLFDTWVKKTASWPGEGKYTRAKNAWIVGYSARFAE